MKLYEPSIYLQDYESLVYQGAASPAVAVDNDKRSVVDSPRANARFLLMMPAGETRTVDSIWLRTHGYSRVEVKHSSPGVSAGVWDIPADGYLYAEFTGVASRWWRVIFTGTGGIYEIYLSKKILDFDNDTDRPRWRMPKFQGVFERTAGGGLVNFQPFGFGGGRSKITVSWPLLQNPKVADLQAAWRGGLGRGMRFGLYPYPSERPRHFFQVHWDGELTFKFGGQQYSDGQTGQAVFSELDVIHTS